MILLIVDISLIKTTTSGPFKGKWSWPSRKRILEQFELCFISSHLIFQVTRQEAEKLAGAYGMRYVETSARDAINVEHAFTELTRDIFALVRSGDITIQEGWEGVKSGFVPNVVHSSEEVTKSDRRCLC